MAVDTVAPSTPLLSVRRLSKTFPGVKALDSVDLTVRAGEIHALMGENGAGKSTLIKAITGVYPPDAGRLMIDGREVRPTSPRHAESLGVSTVYQEINLVPTLSVAENLCLGRFPTRFRMIRWRDAWRRTERALEKLGLKLGVRRQLSEYSIAVQQMIAIARALDTNARVLILDEPTSSLDEKEVNELFAVMARLRDEGMGIIFVTHFLDQVYRISNRITVLRNGELVGEFLTRDLPRLELIARMIGRDADDLPQRARKEPTAEVAQVSGQPLVEVDRLGRAGSVAPVSMKLEAGRVVGLAGLLGSGRTEVAKLIFGVDQADTGQVKVDGRPVRVRSPRHALRLGFAMTPEDRKDAGIIPSLSVRENIALALQCRRGVWRRVTPREQRELADRFVDMLQIKTPSGDPPVRNLSGGNQQKVLLARWLAVKPRLFILDEPTRGIDVGAKAEIEKLIGDLTREGMSVLFISSELEEVVRTSHRVVVMCDRRQVGKLVGEQISESEIMAMIARHGEGGGDV